METPECDKMLKVRDQSQLIGEFLDWLQTDKALAICRLETKEEADGADQGFVLAFISTEKLLADYFDIDLDKVEQERCAILKQLRQTDTKKVKRAKV